MVRVLAIVSIPERAGCGILTYRQCPAASPACPGGSCMPRQLIQAEPILDDAGTSRIRIGSMTGLEEKSPISRLDRLTLLQGRLQCR